MNGVVSLCKTDTKSRISENYKKSLNIEKNIEVFKMRKNSLKHFKESIVQGMNVSKTSCALYKVQNFVKHSIF